MHTLSSMNIVVKNAADTNFLVPSDSDIDLLKESNHVHQLAENNKMLLNLFHCHYLFVHCLYVCYVL